MGHTHTLLSPTVIVKEALRLFKNNLVMGDNVYMDYEKEFPGMPKTGGSVQIRKPVRFQSSKTRVRVTSTITEQYITLNVATQDHVSWQFSSVDLTLTIEEYSNRYIRPAVAKLANDVDADLCALYKDVPNMVWESTGYVTPSTFMVLGKAMQKLDENAVPPDDRCIVFNPAAHWSFANALSNWNFKEGGERALRKGFLGEIANAAIYMDQNIKTHTVGALGTDTSEHTSGLLRIGTTADSAAGGGLPTGVGVGATQNQRLIVGGVPNDSANPFKDGDIFEIAGCNAVNPMSGESTGSLRQFVVTTDIASATDVTSTDSVVEIEFQPDMIHTGPYKTVDTIPALTADVVVRGYTQKQYPQNLAFHRNAFALVMVPLEMPDGVWGARETEDGFSIRVVKDYSIDADVESIRLDILYGVKTIYPELACRIYGQGA
jgi:hypothetical protein